MLLAALLAQAVPAPGAQRWSILQDPACRRSEGDDIVVCAPGAEARARPLPGDPPPDRPRQPTGEGLTGVDALTGPPCALRGCDAPVAVDLLTAGRGVVEAVRHGTRRRHPGVRVPIPLD